MTFNKVILMGRMTRDPQIKNLASGSSVCEFGLAINRKYKVNGDEREEVCFVDCAAFGRTGEVIAEFCQRGKSILVEGRLKYDSWEDKNGGGKRSKLSVVVDTFQFLGGRRDDAGDDTDQRPQPRQQPRPAARATREPGPFEGPEPGQIRDSDIPF